MTDWATVASLATAGGTLILALATFASVRSAHRAARVAEYSMQIGIRPLLLPSRLDAPTQKIMWSDEHWASLAGGQAVAEIVDANVYLAMSLRNSGSGRLISAGGGNGTGRRRTSRRGSIGRRSTVDLKERFLKPERAGDLGADADSERASAKAKASAGSDIAE